jgi:hypothetical protein
MRPAVRWAPLVALFAAPLADAKACTSGQITALVSIATTYSGSPDCAGSALDSSANTVAEICGGACMKLVRQLEPDAPDCEYDGTNLGETMGTLVSWCDAAASGSASSASAGSATNSTIVEPDTVPTCSVENITVITELDEQAATSVDCLGSAGAATDASTKTEFCAENACVAYLTDVEAQLPNCTYGGYNAKQSIADVLALCDDPSLTWAPSTTPPATRATATLTPAVTTHTPAAASSSASSLATDTPAATKSAASSMTPGSTATALVLMMALAAGGL